MLISLQCHSLSDFVFVCICLFGFAQDIVVSGTVTGSDVNESLPQVNVVVKGTTVGTVTDLDGKYEITLSVGQNTLPGAGNPTSDVVKHVLKDTYGARIVVKEGRNRHRRGFGGFY